MEHTPSGGCNEIMIALILMHFVLKLVRKFKASLSVQLFSNDVITQKAQKLPFLVQVPNF